MTDQQFKLPGSSYDEIVKIIRAYAHHGGRASNPDIARRVGIDPTTVSRNGGFLIDAGIVDKGQKKEITSTGKQLAHALDHDIADEVRSSWSQIVDSTPFFETILSAIRIRKGMDPSTLRSHIAYTAGQSKTKYVATGAQTVIDVLRIAGRLEEEDGRLIAKGQDPDLSYLSPESTPQTSTPQTTYNATVTRATRYGSPVSIQIQIQCTPADLDGLGSKLRDLIQDLSATVAKDGDE